MKVLDTRVLIKIEATDEPITKIGSIELKTTKEFETATVIEVGEKVSENLHKDDKVLVYPGAGKEITVKGEKFRVISSSEIIVIL